jgi:hypothetical protein
MSTEENKAVARQYFEEFLNQGKGVVGEDFFLFSLVKDWSN